MLDTTSNPFAATAPAGNRRLTLRPTAAAQPVQPFTPASSADAEALVRDAPKHAASRRPAAAPAPADARYGLD